MSSEVVSNSALRLDTGFQPLFQVPSRNLINVARVLTGNDGDFSVKYTVANLPKETAKNPQEFIKQQQAFVKDYTNSLKRYSDEQRAFIENVRETADKAKEDFDKLAKNKELTRFEKLLEFADNTRAKIPDLPRPKIPEPPPSPKELQKTQDQEKTDAAERIRSADARKAQSQSAEQVFQQRQEKVEKAKQAEQRDDVTMLFRNSEKRNDQFKADKKSQDDNSALTAVQQRLDRGRTERAKALRELEEKKSSSDDKAIEQRRQALRAQEAKQAYAKTEPETDTPGETEQRRSA